MRQMLCAAFVALTLTGCMTIQREQDSVEWKRYSSPTLKFEIQHPATWKVDVVNQDYLVISPFFHKEWTHGLGLPPSPHPWIEIDKRNSGNCKGVQGHQEFEPYSFRENTPTDFYDIVICRNGLIITVGYWEGDPNKEQTRKTLLVALDSLKPN